LEAIEAFMGKKVSILDIDKKEYHKTIDFSMDTTSSDLKALMQEVEDFENRKKKKKKK
jgi:ATP-dependent RNA helicase RhlE